MTSPKAKQPSTTGKTSLYRLRSSDPVSEDLRSLLLRRYLEREGFHARQFTNSPLEGLLITGTVAPGTAGWCSMLSGLTGLTVEEENRTSFGLLLVRTDRHIYALSYGMGHLMLDPSRIDPGFGIEFAVRCLEKDRITRVRRQVMDARGRTDENSATSGEHIRGFGIEEFGEIVSQISGQVSGVPLTFTRDGSRPAHITGNDRSIKLHLGRSPEALFSDLQAVERVCARPDPLPEFEFITQVRPLLGKSDLARRLDERLDSLLGSEDVRQMALTVPSEARERFDLAEAFRVSVAGHRETVTDLDAESLVRTAKSQVPGRRLEALRKGRVTMFADTDASDPISRALPADQWLTVQIPDANVHYFYWQGQWYEVGAEYLTMIRRRVTELLSRPTSITLPPWPARTSEDKYNELASEQEGYLLFDKNTVRTKRLRGGGLEICDLLGPEGQLIHIKRADGRKGTAPLNHLFAQGRMSLETLRYDAAAKRRFIEKIDHTAPDHPTDRSFTNPTVVFGIFLKGGVPMTVDSLFAFAQVSLLHTETALRGMGAELEVVSIRRGGRDRTGS
jgi:uncharacterized protein (TIGR04141 family)